MKANKQKFILAVMSIGLLLGTGIAKADTFILKPFTVGPTPNDSWNITNNPYFPQANAVTSEMHVTILGIPADRNATGRVTVSFKLVNSDGVFHYTRCGVYRKTADGSSLEITNNTAANDDKMRQPIINKAANSTAWVFHFPAFDSASNMVPMIREATIQRTITDKELMTKNPDGDITAAKEAEKDAKCKIS